MVKKKILVSLLTAAVTLTMLAGCGSGQDNAASNEDNAGNTSAATEGNAADEGTERNRYACRALSRPLNLQHRR